MRGSGDTKLNSVSSRLGRAEYGGRHVVSTVDPAGCDRLEFLLDHSSPGILWFTDGEAFRSEAFQGQVSSTVFAGHSSDGSAGLIEPTRDGPPVSQQGATKPVPDFRGDNAFLAPV